MAIKLAVQYACSLHFDYILIEYDCKVIVKAIKKPSKLINWDCFDIVDDIVWVISSMNSISIAYVPRSANRAAHWFASAKKRAFLPKDWVSLFPNNFLMFCWLILVL